MKAAWFGKVVLTTRRWTKPLTPWRALLLSGWNKTLEEERMLAESNSYSLSFSTQQVVSLASLSQETQDRSSLLGKVGDLLGSLPLNRCTAWNSWNTHRSVGFWVGLPVWWRILAPDSSKALRRERSPRA